MAVVAQSSFCRLREGGHRVFHFHPSRSQVSALISAYSGGAFIIGGTGRIHCVQATRKQLPVSQVQTGAVGFRGRKRGILSEPSPPLIRTQVRAQQESSPSPMLFPGSVPAIEGRALRDSDSVGVVIVDHGSRRQESNDLLNAFLTVFKAHTGRANVEPAHMEMAEPTIDQAFARCVEGGATAVIISPYFLSPGRHWDQDIPRLAAAAAEKHPGVKYLVTAPIGVHQLVAQVVEERIQHCLAQTAGSVPECSMCAGSGRCRMRGSHLDLAEGTSQLPTVSSTASESW